jgi:Domain of unknown function (DUF4349)/Putative zinc-finger
MQAVEHPIAAEELMAFLDGELPVERAAAVHTHVTACETCQRRRAELRDVSNAVTAWEVGDAPASLRPPLLPSANDSQWSLASWLFGSGYKVAAFAGVCVSALVIALAMVAPLRVRDAASSEGSLGRSARAYATPATPPPAAVERATSGHMGQETAKPAATAPMIARTARLQIVTSAFDSVRPAIDRIVAETGGFVGQVDFSAPNAESRSLNATVRIPVQRVDAALASLRRLGSVLEESQNGEDVTDQVVDLDARLANARNTEKRLTDLLQKRTGDLSDVLAAEREVARVREEIERLDATRKQLGQRVTYASVTLHVTEERRSSLNLGPLSIPTQLRNAIVDGFTSAFQSGLDASLFIARVGPPLAFWLLVLGWPAVVLARRLKTSPVLAALFGRPLSGQK